MTAKVLQFAKGNVSAMRVLGNGISKNLKKKIEIAGDCKETKRNHSLLTYRYINYSENAGAWYKSGRLQDRKTQVGQQSIKPKRFKKKKKIGHFYMA